MLDFLSGSKRNIKLRVILFISDDTKYFYDKYSWIMQNRPYIKLFHNYPESVTFSYRISNFKPASVIGIFMNIYNIFFLTKNRDGINLTASFVNLLVLLASFDTLFLLTGIGLFGFPAVSDWYSDNVLSQILPKG